jgi:hypothetical protein
VALAPLIDQVIGTARQLAEQNNNRLVVEVPEDLGTLTVDPMRLRQILLNLLSNACKFTKQGDVTLWALGLTRSTLVAIRAKRTYPLFRRLAGCPPPAPQTTRPRERLNPPSCQRPRHATKGSSSPCGCPHGPLISYRINRQLSGWNLPPLVIRAFGAHCQ